MVDRLDEVLKKFVSVFLLPIVNLLCLSLILYLSSKGLSADAVRRWSTLDISTGALSFASEFLKSNSDAIKDLISHYKSEIGSVGYFVAVTTTIFLVLTVYFLDRVAYYVGYFLPPSLEFDINRYAHRNGGAVDGKIASYYATLTSIFGKEIKFPHCYRIIRAYLGEKNADPQRMAVRFRLVQRVDRTRTVFCYLYAYWYFAIGIFFYSLLGTSSFVPLNAFWLILLLAGGLIVVTRYYVWGYQRLVDFDIASFIWERAYKKADLFDAAWLSVAFAIEERAARGVPIDRWHLRLTLLGRDEI